MLLGGFAEASRKLRKGPRRGFAGAPQGLRMGFAAASRRLRKGRQKGFAGAPRVLHIVPVLFRFFKFPFTLFPFPGAGHRFILHSHWLTVCAPLPRQEARGSPKGIVLGVCDQET